MQISFFVDPEHRPPAQLLRDWFSLEHVAAAVASTGARVTVVQASVVPGTLTRDGVEFVFMAPEPANASLARTPAFQSLLCERAPDVVHVHGLGFARDVLALREVAPRVPILLQDHADRVPRFWRRGLWLRGFAAADGISFCARAQADPCARAGMLPRDMQVFEIPESTRAFTPGNTAAARGATGLRGNPAVLSVGHLDRNKDPLTVLDGIATAVRHLPGITLTCCFGSAPLLSDVEGRVARDPELRDRVRLLGRVPHAEIEQLMRAADLFVLGSHREGSGFALIEALATGLTPVVTDIPSLRVLTGNGAVGQLWRCGDCRTLAGAFRAAAESLGEGARSAIRAHFDEHLSGPAVGRKFAAAYASLTRAPAARERAREEALQ
jgi:glycosyltransferase involved in cell wall biosynthesis